MSFAFNRSQITDYRPVNGYNGSLVDDVGDENGVRSVFALRAMTRKGQREPNRRPLSSPLSFTCLPRRSRRRQAETVGNHAGTSAPCTEPVQSFPGLKALIGFRLKPVLRPCLAETYLGEASNPHVRFYGSVRIGGAKRTGPRSRKKLCRKLCRELCRIRGLAKACAKEQ